MTSCVSKATNTAPSLQGCTTHSLPTTYIQQRIKKRGHDGSHGDWVLSWHVGKSSSFSCTDIRITCANYVPHRRLIMISEAVQVQELLQLLTHL